ncbi:MAG TPA: type 4a pilus biogenesis protein PilO [Limnobacter sp.]|nr:type 4a pilus biogenesis protein PilO [Limnobacter sp.]
MQLNEMTIENLLQELPRLKPLHRVLLIAASWFAFGVCGFLLSWQDSLQDNLRMEGEIQSSLARLESQSRLISDGPLIEAELAGLESQLPVLKMALPTERELASLLVRINDLILANDMKLAEFTPQPPVNQEVMRVVPVKINLRGEGSVISQLPNHIARLSRQVSMKQFEMSQLPGSSSWQVTGELNAFAQLPPEEKKP